MSLNNIWMRWKRRKGAVGTEDAEWLYCTLRKGGRDDSVTLLNMQFKMDFGIFQFPNDI